MLYEARMRHVCFVRSRTRLSTASVAYEARMMHAYRRALSLSLRVFCRPEREGHEARGERRAVERRKRGPVPRTLCCELIAKPAASSLV